MLTKIQNELKDRLTKSNFKEIQITMKYNKDILTITPCSETGAINNIDDIDYYLIHSPSLPWMGGDTLEEIAKQIANYQTEIENIAKEKAKLEKFYQEKILPHKDDAEWKCSSHDWEYYSDWYKELYGHRPR